MKTWSISLDSEDGWTKETAEEAEKAFLILTPRQILHGLRLVRRRYVHRELGFRVGRTNWVKHYIDWVREEPHRREQILDVAKNLGKLGRTSLWRIRKATQKSVTK